MERLTKRSDFTGLILIEGKGYGEAYFGAKEDYDRITKALHKLAAYEDAEEQGRLIVLPNAEIGETLFYVINGKIYEGELYRVAYENYHGKIHTDVSAAKGYNSFGSRFEDFGKTVFLTREAAEKALQKTLDTPDGM